MTMWVGAGEQFGQTAGGVGGDAREHIPQVSQRLNLVALASGDEAEEDRGGVAAIVRAAEEPVCVRQSLRKEDDHAVLMDRNLL